MRLEGERESANVEDRRGGGGLPIGVAGGGIGTVVLVVLALLMGVDPRAALDCAGPVAPPQIAHEAPSPPAERPDGARRSVSRVLASTEDVWAGVFRENGRRYDPPRLVLFSGAVRSACGIAGAAVGPFYCPADQHIYIDLAFFRDMERQLGAPGDFARAYVIAHAVGHHLQAEFGIAQEIGR